MLKLENSIRGLSFSRVAFDLTIQDIKRRISHKEQFLSIESLDSFVCTFASEYNTKYFGKIHRGFGVAFSQLQNILGD